MDRQLVRMDARTVAAMPDNTQITGPFGQVTRTILGNPNLRRDEVLVAAEHRFANGSTSSVMAMGTGDQVCNAVVSSLTGTLSNNEVRQVREALEKAIERMEKAEQRAADAEAALMRSDNEKSFCQHQIGELKGRINELETVVDRLMTENAQYASQAMSTGKRSRFEADASAAPPADKPKDDKSIIAGLLARLGGN